MTPRYLRRRRQCAQCGERYTTHEIYATEHQAAQATEPATPAQVIGGALVEALRLVVPPCQEHEIAAMREMVASLAERMDKVERPHEDAWTPLQEVVRG